MKKLLAIILALIMLVNFCGVFTLKAEAVVGVDDVAVLILTLVGSFVVTGLGTLLADSIEDNAWKFSENDRALLAKINDKAIQNGELIQIREYGGGGFAFIPASGLSETEQEFAEYFCNALNSDESMMKSLRNEYEQINSGMGGSPFDALTYSQLKTDVIKAFYTYINDKAALDESVSGGKTMLDAGLIEDYNFTFVGPMSPLQLATQKKYVNLDIDGFSLSAPHIALDRAANHNLFPSYSSAELHGATLIRQFGVYDGLAYYDGICEFSGVYGYGYYVIYNDDVFYYNTRKHGTSVLNNQSINALNPADSFVYQFYNSNGEQLYAAGCTTLVDEYYGIFYITSPDVTTDYPKNVKKDDLTTTTGGGVVTPSRTAAEDTIGEAMQLGLISTNPTLTLDDNGNITAADGIDLATLESLVKQLADSQIKFSDLKGYLEAIQTACQNTDLDEDEIKRLLKTVSDNMIDVDNLNKTLKGVKDSIDSQSDTLSKIESNTAAIAEALTAAGELEIERDSTELNAIIGEHTGLTEANEFVNRWTLIKQCKSIFENVLDPDRYLTNAPNFNFYFDSDNDGKVEKYTALDLSFLETTLTNDNLEDKGRFYKPMTVREFIQLLLIFVCWISFAMKLIRKLPGLISGGESSIDTGLEMANIDRANTLKSLKSLR